MRRDLEETLERQGLTRDEARSEAVEKRHAAGRRTARENIADLVDPGTFVEYGALAIAAQRARRELKELLERTPADGLIAGVGRVNGELFGEDSSCAVLSYDYTVLAGSQGVDGAQEEGPALRADRADEAADGLPRRGRGRAPRRYRPRRGLGARDPRLRALGAALGRGAADRDRLRALLRRQRGDRRLLGSDRRHRGRLARDGRPGDDRGRRPRHRRRGRRRPVRDADLRTG